MRHWTQVPTGPGGSREEELGGSPVSTAKASPFPTPPPNRLAASLSLQPSGHPDAHPNRAREIDPRPGEQLLQPLERQPGKGKQRSSRVPPLPTAAQNSLVSNGTEQGGGAGAQGGSGAQGPCASPSLLACPPQGKSGNWPHFGHFSQLGSFSFMP